MPRDPAPAAANAAAKAAANRHRALLLLPIAALLAILPLLVHGCSCGHDLVFHVQSWLDAAQQLRHGHYPRWAFSPAWNAGEPRFIFYPPLSWLLGALLTTIFPTAAAPQIYIFLALTAASLSMYHLASRFVSSNAALLAAALYLANPYMLFNAFERSALAELLAAAWIPLLLLAALRPRPTLRGVALPIALLWLTNAPAAVMGCYTFALIVALRLIARFVTFRRSAPRSSMRSGEIPAFRLALTTILGAALGLALPAFYLIPAAFERRYVQVAMAVIPNLRFQDNFLFTRTAYEPHNVVTHTISALAVVLLLLTVAILSAVLLLRDQHSAPTPVPATTRAPVPATTRVPHVSLLRHGFTPPPALAPTLAVLTLVLTFLLVPISTPIWQHLPELAFLQFPWRLLTILAAVLCLGIALLLGAPSQPRAPFMTRPHRGMGGVATTLAALLCPLLLAFLCFHLYGQACAVPDRPSAVATLFRTHHGAAPTDEYTPTNADNDTLRSDDPGYWLTPDPQAFAPHTLPNPIATNPDYDKPTPIDQTVSAHAPTHLTLNLAQPEDLILNLRDFPDWRITETSPEHPNQTREPARIQRDDGLLAIALPAGASTIDISWCLPPDQELGDALSLCALLALILTFRRNVVISQNSDAEVRG